MSTRTLIMAIPWDQRRVRRAIELKKSTGGEIVWDQERNAMATWRSVLREAGEDPVIILEDDIHLAPRWRERVEHVIEEIPNSVVQFFSLRKRDLTEGSRWEPGRTFMMNQCYYLPQGVAARLLEYSEGWEENNPENVTGYDILMARWMQETGQRYWLHVPSLVQHEPWRSEIQPRRPVNRQSPSFGLEEGSE